MKEENGFDFREEKRKFSSFLYELKEAHENTGYNKAKAYDVEIMMDKQLEKLISMIQPLTIENHNLKGKIAVLENEIQALKKQTYDLECQLES